MPESAPTGSVGVGNAGSAAHLPFPQTTEKRGFFSRKLSQKTKGKRKDDSPIKISERAANAKVAGAGAAVLAAADFRFVLVPGSKGRLAVGKAPNATRLGKARADGGMDILVMAEWDSITPQQTDWCSKQEVQLHNLDVWRCYLMESRRSELVALGASLVAGLQEGKHILLCCES
eukprot:gene1531-28600_t